MAKFAKLVKQRWVEAQAELGPIPGLTWDMNEDYPHFKTPRGFGVTLFHPAEGRYGAWCHMRYPSKMLKQPKARQDGVLRHELGHVIDLLTPKAHLNRWAKSRGIKLASTDERRADDIARAVWGTPIYYDNKLLVQTTQSRGASSPRPRHLGL